MSQEKAEWVTMRGVCAFFGCPKPVNQSTVYRWIQKGILPPAVKIGGMHRWRKSDLQAVYDKMVSGEVQA